MKVAGYILLVGLLVAAIGGIAWKLYSESYGSKAAFVKAGDAGRKKERKEDGQTDEREADAQRSKDYAATHNHELNDGTPTFMEAFGIEGAGE